MAAWLRAFHDRFAKSPPAGGHLLAYGAQLLGGWRDQALAMHPDLSAHRPALELGLRILTSAPPTFIHGEFYPSNVMVAEGRIAPVDWEMAGIGAGALDVAALLSGWDQRHQAEISSGYGKLVAEQLHAAQLYVALRWLGQPPGWRPPDWQRNDWRSQALAAARRLANRRGSLDVSRAGSRTPPPALD